jgi:nucleoside-diphosphate-sugar epimerase
MQMPADTIASLRASFSGKRVCVTGGAGFIGGHLVDTLLAAGAQVQVIDDLSNSDLTHLAPLVELEPDRVTFVRGSILEDAALAEAINGCKVVFHLAAMGSVPLSIEQPERAWEVNATGTLRVLQAAHKADAHRVVFAASSSAYGDTVALPKVETMPPCPKSPYAVTKLAGEQLMRVWSECYGLSTACVRYFNIFGPRQSADSAYAAVIAAFASRLLAGQAPVIYGDGTQTRDFTFVSNAVLATMLAGSSSRPLKGEVMNVGVGTQISLLQLAEQMRVAAGLNGQTPGPIHKEPRAGDVDHSLADISLARELIGYEPIARFEDGIQETVSWYRSQLSGSV